MTTRVQEYIRNPKPLICPQKGCQCPFVWGFSDNVYKKATSYSDLALGYERVIVRRLYSREKSLSIGQQCIGTIKGIDLKHKEGTVLTCGCAGGAQFAAYYDGLYECCPLPTH